MREIEFRGISQIDGRWVYGSLLIKELQKPNWEDLTKLQYVYNYEICCKDENDWTSLYENIPVSEQTIGQYTGLKDKNGTKIFEGDIVKYLDYRMYDHETFENAGIMEFADGQFYVTNRECVMMDDLVFAEQMDDCEVIGNIYNNPKILKGE